MEHIVNVTQFEKMKDNKIIGMPKLVDSHLIFNGKNNILVCDNNIVLNKVSLEFNGNNSIVYLGSNLKRDFKLRIFSNSTLFMGRDISSGLSLTINVFENQNVIIGDDCFIGDYIYISNADNYPIYTCDTKERINYSNSIYIGDHVYLGHKFSNAFAAYDKNNNGAGPSEFEALNIDFSSFDNNEILIPTGYKEFVLKKS